MLEWIISSSVLIAVVIGLRFALKGKISLRLQYALWALVLLRLLLPVSFGSTSISIMNQVEKSQVYQDATEPEINRPEINRPETVVPGPSAGMNTTPAAPNTETPPVIAPGTGSGEVNTGNTQQPEQTTPVPPENPSVQEVPTDEAENRIDWLTVLRRIWLGGSALLGVWLLLTNLLFAAKLRKSRSLLQTAHKLPVYVCDSVDTPCLFGFFRPAVYLTSEVAADERTMRHALEHEKTHYRHGDHIWAILRCVCLTVHWYNPLVWWAAILSKHDAELACDESTIRRLGEGERAEYGRTLLRLTCEKRTAIMTTATTMTGSGKTIKERIALIVKKPKMAVYTLIAVLVIAAVAIVCTFTGAKDKEKEIELWPEDTVISCARFECADDNGGYKLITSEVSQFNSLRHMNLIPADGEFTGEVIYRLVLNWNEVAKNEVEYIILVSEDYLSVNGQLYQPDGFDFSEILSYFEGKYRYFDYELLYDEKQDTDENSGEVNTEDNNETEIPKDIAYLLHLLETIKIEDVTGYSDNMQADTETIVPLINAAAKTYAGEFDVVSQAEWFVDLHLSDRDDDSGYNPEVIGLRIGISEGIVDVHCRLDANADPSDYVDIRLHSMDLWNYIFSLYNPGGIDQNALALYEDILAERAAQTMEEHNTTGVERGFPAFTGFEIRYLRLVDSFDYGGYTYKVYGWDAGFLTDDPNPGRYGWPQDGWVDEQNRVIMYEWCRVFVAAWRHDVYEYEFTNWGISEPSSLYMRAQIIKDFTGEEVYLEGEPVYQNTVPITSISSLYTNKGVSIEVPNQLDNWIQVDINPDSWCYGIVMNPTYYSALSEQTLFSLHHTCEYWENGEGLIFSVRRYTEEEYQTMYINSYSRQQVFARDDNYYYCVFLPTGDHAHTPETEEKLDWYLAKILPDMIERNGWLTFSDHSVRIRDLGVVPEEYKDIIRERAEETLVRHNRSYEDRDLPFFTGYEILSFEPKDSFSRDGADYEIYQWEIVFYTDDPNADAYPWGGSPFVDNQYRVHYYDQYTFFVVCRNADEVKSDFFHFDLYSDPQDVVFDLLVEHFNAEPETLPVIPLSDSEATTIHTAIMTDLKTGWWKGGGPLVDCTYEAGAFECVWRETYEYTERYYGYAGYFRFDENGNCVEYWYSPAIVTLDANTQQMYNVWWPGDGAYHEMDILARFPDEIAEFVAEPNEERYQVILGRLMASAKVRVESVASYSMSRCLSTLEQEWQRQFDRNDDSMTFLRVDGNRERALTVEGNMLSVLSSAANRLQDLDNPDDFRALGGGIYIWFDSTRHLAFFAGEDLFHVKIRYVADDVNESALVIDPQLYLYLVASAERENVQLVNLDGSDFFEAILWQHSEKNLIIYACHGDDILRIDTNQTIGCSASSYTGLIANIKPEYRCMIQAQSEDGSVSIYRYHNGTFSYVCPISEALNSVN